MLKPHETEPLPPHRKEHPTPAELSGKRAKGNNCQL